MQLIKLSANNKGFKTVHFKNETGINLIVAIQKDSEKSDRGDTTNGVGKSLLIAIIHFCLGANSNKSFNKSLNDWEFTLEFKIKSNRFTTIRNTNSPLSITLNGESLKLNKFKERLEELTFRIPDNTSELTFRSLISFFIRPRKSSYSNELNPNAISKNYQVQLINAFLMGLDISLAQEKNNLKIRKDQIGNLVKSLKEDDLVHEFLSGNKDITLAKTEIEDSIARLEQDLKRFDVAEDYYQIKVEADTIQKDLQSIQNTIALRKIQIKNIEESLEISPDIKRESIKQIYEEAAIVLKNDVVKKLAELECFYEQLSLNRSQRLNAQKIEMIRDLKLLELENHKKNKELDEKLKYLNAHQALDVFLRLSEKASDLKSKKTGIERFENLMTEYNNETRRIKKLLIEETEITEKYLTSLNFLDSEFNTFFRQIIKRFYPKAASGITVYNNEKENKIRYDIEARIEADKSDGIAKIKLFTYDLTLLLKGLNHHIDFLFHDSRLLDGVDPRQKAELFLILNEFIKQNNKQYILTVNFNQIEELKNYLTKDQYKDIITNNTILELKDSSNEEKLLGIQVDIDY